MPTHSLPLSELPSLPPPSLPSPKAASVPFSSTSKKAFSFPPKISTHKIKKQTHPSQSLPPSLSFLLKEPPHIFLLLLLLLANSSNSSTSLQRLSVPQQAKPEASRKVLFSPLCFRVLRGSWRKIGTFLRVWIFVAVWSHVIRGSPAERHRILHTTVIAEWTTYTSSGMFCFTVLRLFCCKKLWCWTSLAFWLCFNTWAFLWSP